MFCCGCRHPRYELAERKFKEAVEESILGFDSSDPHIASAKVSGTQFPVFASLESANQDELDS